MDHTNERRTSDAGVYTVQYDREDGEPLSTAVVVAVTAAAELDPHEIEEPLYEVIDPDALDDLFRPQEGTDVAPDSEVSFTLAGHRVTVSAGDTITVRPQNSS